MGGGGGAAHLSHGGGGGGGDAVAAPGRGGAEAAAPYRSNCGGRSGAGRWGRCGRRGVPWDREGGVWARGPPPLWAPGPEATRRGRAQKPGHPPGPFGLRVFIQLLKFNHQGF